MLRNTAALILIFSLLPKAHGLDARVVEGTKSSDLRLGLQLSQLTLPTGTLAGLGPVAGFDFLLTRKFSIGLSVTQSYGSQDSGSSVLFTGLTGEASYTLLGTNRKGNVQTEVFGVRAGESLYGKRTNILVGANMSQLFLNGTTSVYPASGPGGHVRSTFYLFNEEWTAEARYSVLLSGVTSYSGIFLTMGWVFSL